MNLYVEIIAVVFSFLSVFFSIKKNILTWSFGLIGVIAYCLIFFNLKMPAEVVLQLIFIIQTLYGWYMWNKPKQEVPIISLEDPDLFFLIATLISIFVSFFLLMFGWTKHPGLDAISTVFSIFANFFLANKIIQTWYYWMIVNISLVWVFLLESMYPSAILYGIFFIMSIFGHLSWRKDLKTD
jgi:nicotinamide mononucleotide transporter